MEIFLPSLTLADVVRFQIHPNNKIFFVISFHFPQSSDDAAILLGKREEDKEAAENDVVLLA